MVVLWSEYHEVWLIVEDPNSEQTREEAAGEKQMKILWTLRADAKKQKHCKSRKSNNHPLI